jgi:hypothetical protein
MLLTKNVFRHPFGSNESSCIGHANKELALFFSTLFIEDKSDVVAVVQPEPTPASPRWRMAITLSQTRGAMTQSAKISWPVEQRRTDHRA